MRSDGVLGAAGLKMGGRRCSRIDREVLLLRWR